jgi:hypothetical protein
VSLPVLWQRQSPRHEPAALGDKALVEKSSDRHEAVRKAWMISNSRPARRIVLLPLTEPIRFPFQAAGFYERHGYRRFGEVVCPPDGATRIFLSKTLA